MNKHEYHMKYARLWVTGWLIELQKFSSMKFSEKFKFKNQEFFRIVLIQCKLYAVQTAS